jgi:hypothetical protein
VPDGSAGDIHQRILGRGVQLSGHGSGRSPDRVDRRAVHLGQRPVSIRVLDPPGMAVFGAEQVPQHCGDAPLAAVTPRLVHGRGVRLDRCIYGAMRQRGDHDGGHQQVRQVAAGERRLANCRSVAREEGQRVG